MALASEVDEGRRRSIKKMCAPRAAAVGQHGFCAVDTIDDQTRAALRGANDDVGGAAAQIEGNAADGSARRGPGLHKAVDAHFMGRGEISSSVGSGLAGVFHQFGLRNAVRQYRHADSSAQADSANAYNADPSRWLYRSDMLVAGS